MTAASDGACRPCSSAPPCSRFRVGAPRDPGLTCAEASALVTRAGAIVMDTGPMTYARFVRDGGFCPLPETTRPAWERTRDNPECFVATPATTNSTRAGTATDTKSHTNSV